MIPIVFKIVELMQVSIARYYFAQANGRCNLPELSSSVVDYVQSRNKIPFIPVSDSRMSAPIVLVIDECLDEPRLQHLQSSLPFFDSILPTTGNFNYIVWPMIFRRNLWHPLMCCLVKNHQLRSPWKRESTELAYPCPQCIIRSGTQKILWGHTNWTFHKLLERCLGTAV